jgi:hypothetical protein
VCGSAGSVVGSVGVANADSTGDGHVGRRWGGSSGREEGRGGRQGGRQGEMYLLDIRHTRHHTDGERGREGLERTAHTDRRYGKWKRVRATQSEASRVEESGREWKRERECVYGLLFVFVFVFVLKRVRERESSRERERRNENKPKEGVAERRGGGREEERGTRRYGHMQQWAVGRERGRTHGRVGIGRRAG